ncbi:hypothetical protein MKW98_031857 [Papaver atlanticum]|uniref:Uncharacterized protein n=1 Tax=Papaver atlanticum TaxID=357466 RepID=A0AAD4SE32_9MAGN|nr:hypothetical protein MKW98_031857 [Papaver atlanticum]
MPIARFLLHFEVKGNTGFFVFIAIDKLHLSSLAAYRILHKRRSCPDSHRSCIRMSISKLLLIHFPWNRKIQPSTPSPTVTHLILCVFHTHQNNDLLPR